MDEEGFSPPVRPVRAPNRVTEDNHRLFEEEEVGKENRVIPEIKFFCIIHKTKNSI